MNVKAFEVVELETGKVIHTVTVDPPTDSNSRRAERIEMGMLRNMNIEKYFVREVTA